MIEVIRLNGEIKIKGHAGYDEPGKDIVCAGVSTLVQTLIQSIEELTSDKNFGVEKEWNVNGEKVVIAVEKIG